VGVWKVTLDAQKAGGPYTIIALSKVNGTVPNVTLKDVYFGDVWVCSGQSNMQFSFSQVMTYLTLCVFLNQATDS
jgi:sialate O-acetylesterase